MRGRHHAAIAAACVLFVAGPALADEPAKPREPTAGDLASARNALKEGLAAREKGDNNTALARLQSAWDYVHTPVTGFELAKTHLILGHVLQAHEMFANVGRMPPSMEESSRSQVARDEAAKLMKELEPRIPSLRVKLMLPPNATATVRIDDEVLAFKGTETTRLVEVGPHDVVAKAGDGPEQTVHVEVAESEVKDIPLSPQWIPPKVLPATGPGGQVVYVRTTNPLTFIGFGVAAAGLIVTTISAVVFVNARNDQSERCGEHYCPPDRPAFRATAPPPYDTQFDDAKNRAIGSGILCLVAGSVTLVMAGVGTIFAMRPVKERVTAVSVKPTFGLGGAGLQGTF